MSSERVLSSFFGHKINLFGFNYGIRKALMHDLYTVCSRLSRQFKVFKKLRDFHLLLCAVFSSLRFKDASVVTPLIKRMFEPVHYSKHRFLYYF